MARTKGINHLGLSVNNLEETQAFFVDLLGWEASGYDKSYPRIAVSDGDIRLTLWEVKRSNSVSKFDRKTNVGLHHLALEMESEEKLDELYNKAIDFSGVNIEFAPELVGSGPRKHMMCSEPSGIRIEFIWQGV